MDVGCGTGEHACELAKRKYYVNGIDISPDMIQVAREKNSNLNFDVMDICAQSTAQQYDMAMAMSHVVGYQLENDMLYNFLANINKSLKKDSIFIFNFYNGAALSEYKLRPMEKVVRGDNVIITRYSCAKNLLINNELLLNYKYIIEDDDVSVINIEERMRYFTCKEIDFALGITGFEVIAMKNYLTEDVLDENEWNGFCIAKKVRELI